MSLKHIQELQSKAFQPCGVFEFVCLPLNFSDSVNHLGNILHYTLDDTTDVARVISDVCRKANYLLHVFTACDSALKLS